MQQPFRYITATIIMKLVYLPSLIILLLFSAASSVDPIDNVAALIRQGNMQEMAKLLAPTVEITIAGQEDTYSKRQATDVLTQFFTQHKPKGVKLLHKVNSNQKFLFGVVILSSTGGSYRIAYTLNETDGAMKIIELRIEPEKTK